MSNTWPFGDYAEPPPELVWLYSHCKALGMGCKSDSGKMEHDIALFVVNLTAERDALKKVGADNTALAGIEPEAWRCRCGNERSWEGCSEHLFNNHPDYHHSWQWDALYSAAIVERLVQERDELDKLYGLQFNENNDLVSERKVLQEQLAAMTQERDRLKDTNWYLNGVKDERLAASQAREQQLREAVNGAMTATCGMTFLQSLSPAITLPQDDTALRQWGAKLLRDAANTAEQHIDYPTDAEDIAFNGKLEFHAKHLRRKADELEEKK